MQAEMAVNDVELRAARAARSWPAVRGHVLSARVLERTGLDGRALFIAEVRYLYNVNARTREGCWTAAPARSRRAAEAVAGRHPPGSRPWIAYDPAAPTTTLLQGRRPLTAWAEPLERLLGRRLRLA